VRAEAPGAAPYRYGAFGLRIAATARIPGLAVCRERGAPHVVVSLAGGRVPGSDGAAGELVYCSADRDDGGKPIVVVHRLREPDRIRFAYADGVRFLLDPSGSEVRGSWPASSTLDDAVTYLLGPVCAFLLRLRGLTCLHASAVAVGDGAVAFVGPPGAGKSTLAATFARRGHRVMSDDVVAIGDADELSVEPGPVRLRLWPESVRALYGTPDALPALTPTWDKRYLDVSTAGCQYQHRRLPLIAVYVLGERSAHATLPRIERLSPAAALLALVANTQASHLADAVMRAREFRVLARIVETLPVSRVIAHDQLGRLGVLYETILADVEASVVRV
jgi:hypothetical protein